MKEGIALDNPQLLPFPKTNVLLESRGCICLINFIFYFFMCLLIIETSFLDLQGFHSNRRI